MTNIIKATSRFKRTWKMIALTLLVVGILLFPLPVHDADRAYMIQRDALRLRSVQPVLLDWHWQPFYDAQLIANRNPRWHLHSRLDFDFHGLEQAGFIRMNTEELKTLPLSRWYEEGNVLIDITDQSSWHKNTAPGLRLHVHHGTVGGQGYTVHVYRCLLGRFARYTIEWVS